MHLFPPRSPHHSPEFLYGLILEIPSHQRNVMNPDHFPEGTEALGAACAGAAPGEGAGEPSGRGALSGSIDSVCLSPWLRRLAARSDTCASIATVIRSVKSSMREFSGTRNWNSSGETSRSIRLDVRLKRDGRS